MASGLTLLILAGCDTTEEPVVLSYTETVQFAFTSEAAMMGQTTTLESKDRQGRTLRIDLTEKLRDDGFSKAEVLGAFVESAELELLAPFGIGLDFLDEATLQVEASGASATTVATENDFPSEREAAMDVRAGADIGSQVTAPNFGLLLQIDPATLQNEEDYEMQLEIRIRVELEGV